MSKEELKKVLCDQLKVIAERSKRGGADVPSLTASMIELAKTLHEFNFIQ